MKARALLLIVLAAAWACGNPQANIPRNAVNAIAKPPPTLLNAIKRSTDLGPAGPGTSVNLDFGLRAPRPDAAMVQRAVQVLNDAGLRSSWHAPSSLILADGPAPAASALLGVQIENYRMPDGTTFYAALQAPRRQLGHQRSRQLPAHAALRRARGWADARRRRQHLQPQTSARRGLRRRRPDDLAPRDRRHAEPERHRQVRFRVRTARVRPAAHREA